MRKLCCLVALMVISAGPVSADKSVSLEMRPDAMIVGHSHRSIRVSLKCPRFVFEGLSVGGGIAPRSVTGGIASGRQVRVTYAPIPVGANARLEVVLLAQWSPKERVLRKWARYRLDGDAAAGVLKEIVLEEVDTGGRKLNVLSDPQSHPAFLDGFFAGIEFPIASTRVEGRRVLLAHRPGITLRPGEWYESRKAVIGIAPPGGENAAFERYIAANRPSPSGFHTNYNSWWTSPVPYTEADVLGLIKTFDEKLGAPHGQTFDTFCIDMGWSNPQSLWEIDAKLFPDGFTNIQRAAESAGMRLGLWISPSSGYAGALENEWARRAGFEVFSDGSSSFACLGGAKYSAALRDRLVDFVTRYGIRHIKFDGYRPACPASDHGHQPGDLSAEPVAAGLISVFDAIRKAAPETWMETTCFGWNPSPWWLFHANSVIGTYGDDAPYGRVPSPVYRESYTTARDYFNLQGAKWLPIPIAAQEVLGLVHQTGDPFANDAVMTILRGHMFMPAYVNPSVMDGPRWKTLADLLKWARANSGRLGETRPLLPESWLNGKCPRFTNSETMPREPYGYAHWSGGRGLIVLRNPWIAQQVYPLKLETSQRRLWVVSLYPEPRVYGRGLTGSRIIKVQLAPYETVVLSVSPDQVPKSVPEAASQTRGRVKAELSRKDVSLVEFEGSGGAYGSDWTSLVGDAASAIQLHAEGKITLDAPHGELLVLIEGKHQLSEPWCRITVNGVETPATPSGSEAGWGASGMPKPEHWLFLRAPLGQGANAVGVELLAGVPSAPDTPRVSIWVWATKDSGDTAVVVPNSLPQPELVSLGSALLLPPVSLSDAARASAKRERPVDRIEGVFLDSLEPESASQGWGSLRKNQSVWEKPMTVNGTRYLRGLGTHAPSRIVYRLDGKYRRFQCWAGADWATSPTVTFEVLVDGVKRWESGSMKRDTPAKRVDLDVAGAKTLELVTGDGGNGLASDHADWADAKLLR